MQASRQISGDRQGSDRIAPRPRRTAVLALLTTLCALAIPAGAIAETLRIVALGDSLTAGYGLPQSAAFPVKLEAALRAKGHDVEVINAGVSGDTASGGLERLEWSVPDGTDAVIVELGANDALRATDPAVTRKALDTIIRRLKSRGISVLLAGMHAPRNMGKEYIDAFDRIYPELAKEHGVLFYPFFLDGVAADPKLNQGDGIHPTASGIDRIVANTLPSVEKLIAHARENGKS
jgi:acyl-CoA thioesterase-1